MGTRIEEEKNLLYVKWNGKGFGETRRIVIVKKIPVMQNRLFSHSPLYMHTLFATQILILNGLGNMHSSQEHLKQWFCKMFWADKAFNEDSQIDNQMMNC